MTVWWQIVVTIVCVFLSGTFSGLTLGLMSLDIIDLRVLTESGTEREKKYARRILPVRKHGNWLLCTLLIGNTAVNSALSIVTADLFGGIAGFASSTIVILYIGEIIPQAVCHRFGLVVGAFAIPFVRLMMFLTAPLSFTTSKVLDWLLGGESATRYNKKQLRSLLSIHVTNQANADGSSPPESDYNNHPPSDDGLPEHDRNLVTSDSDRDVRSKRLVNKNSLASERRTNNNVHSSEKPNSNNGSNDQHVVVQLSQLPTSPISLSNTKPQNGVTNRALPQSAISGQLYDEEIMAMEIEPQITEDEKGSRAKGMRKLYIRSRKRFMEKQSRKEHEKREKGKEKESEKTIPPLTRDEMVIFNGAFEFSQKTVRQVMTIVDDVFMLEASLSLNFEVLLLIFQSGHSRIPVYDKTKDTIIGLLFAKDLVLLDPEDCVSIKTILFFFNRTMLQVACDTPLNEMLNIFRQGGGHMAIVQKTREDDNDNTVDIIGIVTLEDLIESLIGQDIVDETDVYTDNCSKKRVKRQREFDPEVLKMFDSKHDEEPLSEKEVQVVASYLSKNIDAFMDKLVNIDILEQMLSEIPMVEYYTENGHVPGGGQRKKQGLSSLSGLVQSAEFKTKNDTSDLHTNNHIDARTVHRRVEEVLKQGREGEEASDKEITIYTRGVPSKNAYLIINGRLEIRAGSDGFISEAGPWTLLGVHALTDEFYAPDFTARVIERPARLLRIPRKLYRLVLQYSSRSRPDSANGTGTSKGGSSNLKLGIALLQRNRSIERDGALSPESKVLIPSNLVSTQLPSQGRPWESDGALPDLSMTEITKQPPANEITAINAPNTEIGVNHENSKARSSNADRHFTRSRSSPLSREGEMSKQSDDHEIERTPSNNDD